MAELYTKICRECSIKYIIPTSGMVRVGSRRCHWCGELCDDLLRAEKTMNVKLTYFKPSGKYYSEDRELELPAGTPMHEIHALIDGKISARKLPGLKEGHSEYIVLIEVPMHPHNCPHLLNADSSTSTNFLSQALNEGDGVYRP